ncbi:MAG: hypothetical protein HXX13_17115 [Bacteroidetes bacterium]|nr:hypothetical protein [Bacteroidota bacterium]
MRLLFLFSFFLLQSLLICAQDLNQSYIANPQQDSLFPGSLNLRISNNNFLRNNEYFNQYTVGITYFGSQIQPELAYTLSQNTRLSVGCFLRYYYGKDKFNTTIPVFRFEYLPLKSLKITFGQLNGLLGHNLLEPVYTTDNYFTRNPENGIELEYNGTRLQSSAWISWDHFILPGDNSKEEITAGMNSIWILLNKKKGQSLSVHLQGIIHHFGGQVDNSDSPLQTRLNLAPGIEYNFVPRSAHSPDITFASYLIQSVDQSGNGTLPYKKGWASYSYAVLHYKPVRLVGSFFHGEYYFAPLGDYLFQSVSEINQWYQGDSRNLVNGKFLFDKNIGAGISMGIRFEAYYEPSGSQLEYSYGMNIKADADWLLFRNRKKK